MSKGSKASADMNQSLKDMQTVLADTKALFEGAFGSAGKAAKEFDAWNNSLEDTVDNIELTVDGFKTMAREGKKLARLSSDQLKDTAQVKKALQEQLKALAAIHRSNVLNKEDSAKSEEMMRAIGKALRGVRDGAADLGCLLYTSDAADE